MSSARVAAVVLLVLAAACNNSTPIGGASCSPVCALGLSCLAGVCVPASCTQASDCPPGFNCQAGFCASGTCAPGCEPSQVCVNALCINTNPCGPHESVCGTGNS